MEFTRPDMTDHENETQSENPRPLQEQVVEVGNDASANVQPGKPSQVPPLPEQIDGGTDTSNPRTDHDSARGRGGEAQTIDQKRAWDNVDQGTHQTYNGIDPVD